MDMVFAIKEHIGVIAERNAGDSCKWTREVNKVSWNDGPVRFDIRYWNESHTRIDRGLTLTEDEARSLAKQLSEYFKVNEEC